MFLKNSWYVAAWPSELGNGDMLARRILAKPVLLFRTSDEQPAALLDRCPHRLVPLSAGQRVGDQIRCGYHGMTFAADGRCVHIPGQAKIPANADAIAFPVVERHGFVWIWMGDTAAADPAAIPHVPWPDLPHWTAANGYTHIAADYRLLTDNLLDLSHENYIHQGTIGNDEEETIADFPVQVSIADGRLIRAHRDMPNIAPPPFFKLLQGHDGRIDRWQTAIWTAPSVNMTDVGARPTGGRREDTLVTRVLHLLTPETETSTHYFWSNCRNFRLQDNDLTMGMIEALHRTFAEDKEMLELQQRELSESGQSVPQMALKVDDAPLRARRMLAALIRQEDEGGVRALPERLDLIPNEDALEPILT